MLCHDRSKCFVNEKESDTQFIPIVMVSMIVMGMPATFMVARHNIKQIVVNMKGNAYYYFVGTQ